jgi:hypothetical protein
MRNAFKVAIAAGSAAAMLLAFISCEEWYDWEDNDRHESVRQPIDLGGDNEAPTDHVAAFKQHVMLDATREPDWLANVTHVRLADGTLYAETTYPPDWRDSSVRTRPAESICGQLFAYAQRGAKLTWTSIQVRASDGKPLVTRQGTGGSCKQT